MVDGPLKITFVGDMVTIKKIKRLLLLWSDPLYYVTLVDRIKKDVIPFAMIHLVIE